MSRDADGLPRPGAFRGTRVVILEGATGDRAMIQGGVDFLGCESTAVETVDQAVERLAESLHHAAFVDLSLPGMGGEETPAGLRRAARLAAPSRAASLRLVGVRDADDHEEPGAFLESPEGAFDAVILRPVALEAVATALHPARPGPGEERGAGREIVRELELTRRDELRIELHTFLNILNLVSGQLHRMRTLLGETGALEGSLHRVDRLLERVREGDAEAVLPDETSDLVEALRSGARAALDAAGPRAEAGHEGAAARAVLGNLESILSVLERRAREWAERRAGGGLEWTDHSAAEIADDLTRFLQAVERNAGGAYHIVEGAASQDAGDYAVEVTVRGREGDTVNIPPVLTDVLRDLVANARKYTPPGGAVSASLIRDDDAARLVVEDSGVGIPAEEVERVVELGYRASNARHRDTWGGGFGLTKAYHLTRRLGGRFWIDSEPGRGTRLSVEIPAPDGG